MKKFILTEEEKLRIRGLYGLINEQATTPICNDTGCSGTYSGPEFIKGRGDVAHQYSNTITNAVASKLKELYRSGKFVKVDFSKIKMTTEGMGSGNVEYFVNIPFVSVNNKCEARTGFGHVGGWNHPPELDNRKKEILSYIPNGENENVVVDNKLDISQLTRTAEGLQEYWIQWRHRHYQNDCKNNTSQNTNQQTNTQLVIKGSGLTDLREKIRLRTQNISINPNQFGSLDLSTYTLTLNPGPQKVQKVTLVWSNISEEDLKQRWVNNFEKENPTIESLGELQTTIINDITFYCHLAYIPA
jgi:hypothetical protein